MEYVEAVLTSIGLLKDMWTSISTCCNYLEIRDNNCATLRDKMERLESREKDISTELQSAQFQRRKKERKEVENWLKEVQQMKDIVKTIEEEAGKRRCLSRLSFLRKLEENVTKVNDLMERGKFPEGLLIDVHQDEELMALLAAQLIGETTAKINLEKIWTCLEEGETPSIGVWGMGGIGKTTIVTHIHYRLLKNTNTFGHVYWVTVSKESSNLKLQDGIANKISSNLLVGGDDEKIRAALLFNQLQKRKTFVLILDDVWEVYRPEAVGIPLGDGGKLIVTTRSQSVCWGMGCKEIMKIESLSMEESQVLFEHTLGRHNALSEKEEDVAKDIVKAIITIATSMRLLNGGMH